MDQTDSEINRHGVLVRDFKFVPKTIRNAKLNPVNSDTLSKKFYQLVMEKRKNKPNEKPKKPPSTHTELEEFKKTTQSLTNRGRRHNIPPMKDVNRVPPDRDQSEDEIGNETLTTYLKKEVSEYKYRIEKEISKREDLQNKMDQQLVDMQNKMVQQQKDIQKKMDDIRNGLLVLLMDVKEEELRKKLIAMIAKINI